MVAGGNAGLSRTIFGHNVRIMDLMLGRFIGLAGTFFGGVLASGSITLVVGAILRIRANRSHRSESFESGSLPTKKKFRGENHRYAPSRNGCFAFICYMV